MYSSKKNVILVMNRGQAYLLPYWYNDILFFLLTDEGVHYLLTPLFLLFYFVDLMCTVLQPPRFIG